jgi:CheY-like chemotaxis protein
MTASPQPDVLLVDLRLPEMGGIELINRLAEFGYPGYVAVTSGVDEETLASVEQAARSVDVNLLGCLAKPVTKSGLVEVLARMPGED